MAIDTCASFVARAASQLQIKTDNKEWYYKLNIRPNNNTSAAQFWYCAAYKLIADNKILIILSDSDELLIADSWTKNEYTLTEDTFESVTVKEHTFKKKFKISEVLYIEFNNQKLEKFTNELLEDYSDLHDRMLEAAKRNNQIRGIISVDATKGLDEAQLKLLQEYIDKIFQAIKNRSIAIAPLLKGFDYKETPDSKSSSNIKIEELTKISEYLIDKIADAIGIPTALLHGNRVELKDNIKAFNKFFLGAFNKKIEDELNAKLVSKNDYLNGKRIEVVGIDRLDMFELAEPIDKLIASGTFNTNEIRKKLGYEDREGGNEYYTTKNYEQDKKKDKKGGEEE